MCPRSLMTKTLRDPALIPYLSMEAVPVSFLCIVNLKISYNIELKIMDILGQYKTWFKSPLRCFFRHLPVVVSGLRPVPQWFCLSSSLLDAPGGTFTVPTLIQFSTLEVLLFKVLQGLSILSRVTLPPSSKKNILLEHSRLTQL